MPVEVILPRVDMDMATGKISRWYVADGETVTKGQVLFEIETDKAAMEVDSPSAGTIRDIAASEGTDIPVGSRVAWIFAEGEAYAPPVEATAAAAAVPADTRPAPAPSQGAPVLPPERSPAPAASVTAGAGNGPAATPLARRLAREHGLELASVPGSGPRGRIQARDVLVRAEALARPAAIQSSAPAVPAPARPAAASAGGGLHREWLQRGEGVPIVLVHGFGASLDGWRSFVTGAAFDCPVLAVDLPGHGRSGPAEAWSLSALAAALEDAVRGEGVASAHFVAHSLGAAVTVTMLDELPVEARSLTLLSPAGLGPEINGAFVDGFLRASKRESLRPWLKLLFADPDEPREAFVAATLRQKADAASVAAQAALAATVFPDGTQAIDIRAVLGRLTAPVKVMFGVDDRIIPARHVQGLPGEIGVHLFSGVGHMPYLERREAVARLVREAVRSGS
ncbi:acetoin dehydrogenase dihydrolipoyllysine-residue acetyltransferase subunit [Chthonobacter albigriseus]|uniref:acetoin dehydrogenase dihydrolipoyllysine-residue acetyltransferase subunit n=1 Tax=Chthonobacter albigriseus TaxID=1683161 RepID=UPI0015EE51E0|nr:acetoin dehydrogenase dihydrolipoyllysine-residue acetyltransferase subunit [Chthonobacter albigriseus]